MLRRLIPALAVLLALLLAPAAVAKPWIGVRGNHLVDRSGKVVRLLGVNRSGAEYECVEGGKIFDGPTDWASVQAIKSWGINAVRLPLNETCWLGINEAPEGLSGAPYREAIREYVDELERAGLYVILDLHWAAPGKNTAFGLIPLPDADHAPAFWRSVAGEYLHDRSVLFDLYNEPHDVGWECWSAPCLVTDKWLGPYQAVGMPQLLEAVRSTGARQPVMLGGLDWARDPIGWMAHRPADPAHALVLSNHTYQVSVCGKRCHQALANAARKVPVVTGELGETDCSRGYVDAYMDWADKHGISYLGWTWNAGGGWKCRESTALIKNYDGEPTRYGIGLRNHLRELGLAPAN
jgi:hypothetical protein